MKSLSEFEVNAIKDILNNGFTKAAETLSFFMNEKISIHAFDFKVDTVEHYKANFRFKEDSKYVLITEVIGEIRGFSYLVFSEADTAKLFELTIPKDLPRSSNEFKVMSNALLLELDNIVSASVITQFSDLLDIRIHGGVPSIWDVHDSNKSVKEFFEGNLQDSHVLNFKSNFSSPSKKEEFSPEFIWILTPTFVEKVKETILKNKG